ncbi:MAG: tetratricopeptide repeat protein [Chitinophagaceae bacterium]|nr:MAG: tetratricopeptide repeat protein [Chitinophagaceae bacterium]
MFHPKPVPIRVILLAIITCCSSLLPAQKVNTDSLRRIISSQLPDTQRIDAMLSLAAYQVKHERDDSGGLRLLRDARDRSVRAGYPAGQVQALLTMGNYHREKNQWTPALESYQEMVRAAATVKWDSLRYRAIMMAYNNLGGIYNFNGDYNNSLANRMKSLEIAERYTPDNYQNLGVIYLNIASDYRQLKIPIKALEYLGKTTGFFDKLSDRLKMEYYYEYYENYLAADSTADAELVLGKLEKGLAEYSLSPFQQKDYALMITRLRGNFAISHGKDYTSGITLYEKALGLARALEDRAEISSALQQLGAAWISNGNPAKAIPILRQAYDSSLAGKQLNLQLKTATGLGEAYRATGNEGEANRFLSEAIRLQSTIYDDEKTKELNFLEAIYQGEKREKEITALKLSGAEKELSIVKRNRMLITGGAVALAIVLLLLLLYRNSRQKSAIAEKEQQVQAEQIRFLERQQQVVSLQSMINGQETERTRMARDLHDGLGGLFSTIRMHFSTLQHEHPDLKTYPLFNSSYSMVNTAAEEVRRIAHNMMPEVLIRIGLVPAVQELCNSISAGKLLTVTMQSYGMDNRMGSGTEIMLYRIIQELLNNIIKHAHATEALIQFNREGNQLNLTVEDNGRGFDTLDTGTQKQAGLDSVKSRVNYLNGTLSIDSEKEVGTTVMMLFLVNDQ